MKSTLTHMCSLHTPFDQSTVRVCTFMGVHGLCCMRHGARARAQCRALSAMIQLRHSQNERREPGTETRSGAGLVWWNVSVERNRLECTKRLSDDQDTCHLSAGPLHQTPHDASHCIDQIWQAHSVRLHIRFKPWLSHDAQAALVRHLCKRKLLISI